ncbi:MAG TPA: CHAP domain-containing protein [Humibacillus xanthopallidus]|nr:CHAP domain-containing protein [Humibacillus xanthopallidus]
MSAAACRAASQTLAAPVPARRTWRRTRRRFLPVLALLLAVLASVGLTAPARSAEWIVLCTGYDSCNAAGYPDSGYKAVSSTSYWRQTTGHNCTNYVAYRLVKNGLPNVKPDSLTGNAYNWGPSFPTQTNNSPARGAVAWWNTSYSATGHVAYVEKVISPSEILVSEDNWGGDFRWRRVTLTGGRWPTGFIHLKDQGTSAPTTDTSWQVAGPVRLLDTRTGNGAPKARVTGGSAITFQVTGRGGMPTSGVDKVLLNINATTPATDGYLTVHASGTTQPTARAASVTAARPNTTSVMTRVGSDGKVRIYTSATTDLSADVVGWSATGGNVAGGAPVRVLDTRTGLSATKAKLAAGGTLTLTVTGRAGVPTSGASAVLLDVSSSGATAGGWLTTYPSGATRPAAPQVRYETGKAGTGLVVARIGTGGAVKIHSSAQTDVMVDIVGWLRSGGDQVALTPTRVFDSQSGLGYPAGRVSAGSAPIVPVLGRAGVPSSGVSAVTVTVTAVSPTASGYLTAYPSGAAETPYATVKYPAAATVVNTIVVPIGPDGAIRVRTSAAAYVKADITGYVLR